MLVIKDLPKMTNAQLQNELKKRGLAESGKKAELVERLSDAIRKEEDAILNADADSTDLTGDASLAAAEALLDDETPDVANTVPEVKNTVISAANIEKAATKADEKKAITTETQAAKLARAQRFGLPIGVGATTANSADAKQKRAERFGLISAVTSEDAKAKRAERFGVASNDNSNGSDKGLTSTDAKAKRGERFGTNGAGAENKDKLFARAQRFGIPVSGDGKRSVAADPELDAKKKARAERFGL